MREFRGKVRSGVIEVIHSEDEGSKAKSLFWGEGLTLTPERGKIVASLNSHKAKLNSGRVAVFCAHWVFGSRIVRAFAAFALGLGAIIAGSSLASADSSVGGAITTDTVWGPAGSPYIVTSDICVYGTDGPDHVTTLTIEPGVIVEFQSNRCMRIANGDIPGELVAKGTANAPITFTGLDTQPGSWKGIFFDPAASDGSIIDYGIIRYGGRNSNANIYLSNASPTVSNTTIQYSDYSGVLCSGTDSRPIIVCNQITENRYGIYTQGGAEPFVRYNTIVKNSEYALYNASAEPTINAERNWWGSAAGPNTSGSGLNKIGGDVDFDPWLTAQPVCPIPEWPAFALIVLGIVFGALPAFAKRRARPFTR